MGWYQLLDIEADARLQVATERARGPLSCPNDGEPLIPTPSGNERFCKWDGYRWPRDGWGSLGEPHR